MARKSLLHDLDPLKLPAVVWIILGLFVSIVSGRLGDKFVLFKWVGIVFLIFGIFKLIAGYMTNKAVTLKEKVATQQAMGGATVICPQCQKTVFHNQFFCHHCGYKLR